MVRLNRTEGYSVRMMEVLTALFRGFLVLVCVLAFPPVGALVLLIWSNIQEKIENKAFKSGFEKGLQEGLNRRNERLEEQLEKANEEIETLEQRLYDAGLDDDDADLDDD